MNLRTSLQASLQPHIVQSQRMSNGMQTVLPRQFYCSLPQRFDRPGCANSRALSYRQSLSGRTRPRWQGQLILMFGAE